MANPAPKTDHLQPYQWKKGGPSPNPGGVSKKLKGFREAVFDKWSPRVDNVLAKLYTMAMGIDPRTKKATRPGDVQAAKLFIGTVAPNMHRGVESEEEDLSALEDEAFWGRVLENEPVRNTVLKVLQGGKGDEATEAADAEGEQAEGEVAAEGEMPPEAVPEPEADPVVTEGTSDGSPGGD